MPVQDFLPIKDVKHTTEKEEKYRPSIEELTTIESPGRSVPASSLENTVSKTKRKARRRIGKAEPSKIEKPKKDSILIITEKPQAANKIANALGNAAKKIDKQVSYYELKREGKTIIVASDVGHLF